MTSISRRTFVRVGLTTTAGAVAAAGLGACSGGSGGAGASAASQCANPEEMSPSETSLRQANHYVEQSADSAKTCSGCTFFTAAADAGACGTCTIYTGGPANAKGYCDSWAAKAPAA